MEIHRNKEWTVPVVTKGDPAKAEVVFDETLHVRAWIDGGNDFFAKCSSNCSLASLFPFRTVPYIRIVTEKCWVSNSSNSEDPPRLILIRNTCPADLSVQVRELGRDQSSAGFSFHVSALANQSARRFDHVAFEQVSKDYAEMGQLFIHCKLGLCTKEPEKMQGNLRMVYSTEVPFKEL